MITLFRKIRQSLIDSGNSAGRYFLYATGEICLVVLGILIALQINNWNENRKTRAFEQKLLTELINSLETDIGGLQFVLKVNKEANNRCERIVRLIEGEETYHDSLNSYFFNSNTFFHHSFNRSAYETTKMHGLHFIKNDSVRTRLSQLYEWQFDLNNHLRDVRQDYYSGTVEPFLSEHFKISFKDDGRELIPLDFAALKKNSKYNYMIKSNIVQRSNTIHWQNRFLKDIIQIRDQLKKELSYKQQ